MNISREDIERALKEVERREETFKTLLRKIIVFESALGTIETRVAYFHSYTEADIWEKQITKYYDSISVKYVVLSNEVRYHE